jgi:hypothetical protein
MVVWRRCRYRTNLAEFQRRVHDCTQASQRDALVSGGVNVAPIAPQQEREAIGAMFPPGVVRRPSCLVPGATATAHDS